MSASNHFQSLLPSCFKHFTTKGKPLSHFLEKLFITKAIYQLNKYNKAWLNTNLTKTLTLYFTVLRVPGIASNILRNISLQFTEILNYLHLHLYTLRLQKTKQDFSQALKQNPPGH